MSLLIGYFIKTPPKYFKFGITRYLKKRWKAYQCTNPVIQLEWLVVGEAIEVIALETIIHRDMGLTSEYEWVTTRGKHQTNALSQISYYHRQFPQLYFTSDAFHMDLMLAFDAPAHPKLLEILNL